jgi:hypothetical protein
MDCNLALTKLMLVLKIFFDRSPTIFGKKIKFEQGIIKKKIIDTAKNFEKIIVHAGNGSPPPPSLF